MSELIYGINVVKAAIESNIFLENLYVLETNEDIIKLAKQNKISYKIATKEFLNKKALNNQGVVAEVSEFKLYRLEEIVRKDPKSLIVVLDSLEDPHNLGAILRTCDAAKVDGIILPKNRSVKLNSTVAKVSTGAIFSVKCVEVVNLVTTIKKLKELGYWIVGAEATTKSSDYRSIKYDMPTVLVIGSEGKGISRLVLEQCDFLVKIPMFGTVNSLNASVSAGILIYEIIKDK